MPRSGIQFLVHRHLSTQFFDDFYVIFPYLSKIRKTLQEYGVAFFLLNVFAASCNKVAD